MFNGSWLPTGVPAVFLLLFGSYETYLGMPPVNAIAPTVVAAPAEPDCDALVFQALATRLAFKHSVTLDSGEVVDFGRLIDRTTPEDGVFFDQRTESWVFLPPHFTMDELWEWPNDPAMPRVIFVNGLPVVQSQTDIDAMLPDEVRTRHGTGRLHIE